MAKIKTKTKKDSKNSLKSLKEKIKSLEPAFDEEGSITAATSSPISIGSSALLITSNSISEKIQVKSLEILSKILKTLSFFGNPKKY